MTKQVMITLPEELIEELKIEAKEQGRSLSNYIFWVLSSAKRKGE